MNGPPLFAGKVVPLPAPDIGMELSSGDFDWNTADSDIKEREASLVIEAPCDGVSMTREKSIFPRSSLTDLSSQCSQYDVSVAINPRDTLLNHLCCQDYESSPCSIALRKVSYSHYSPHIPAMCLIINPCVFLSFIWVIPDCSSVSSRCRSECGPICGFSQSYSSRDWYYSSITPYSPIQPTNLNSTFISYRHWSLQYLEVFSIGSDLTTRMQCTSSSRSLIC